MQIGLGLTLLTQAQTKSTNDITGLVGETILLPNVVRDVEWSWQPLDFNGWGWDCAQRGSNNVCKRWSWDQLEHSNQWNSIFPLENVEETSEGLLITNLGMSDNRRYSISDPTTGETLHEYELKVGRLPSFPTDLDCVTFAGDLKMQCKWDMGLQSFLPWAKSDTKLHYKKVTNIIGWSNEQLSQLTFNASDHLLECPKYCTEGNMGCCEFQLTLDDLVDNDLVQMVTFLMRVQTFNIFGSVTMKLANSEIISHSPAMNIMPLAPTDLTATPPNDYDGYSMIVRWNHQAGEMSHTMYNYRVQYRLKSDSTSSSTNWQNSKEVLLNELELNSMMIPFHDYEFRVMAKPVMKGIWSQPSQIITSRTASTQPTANINPKYTILSYSSNIVKIKFFWLPYQQHNAPNNRFRIRVKTRKCLQKQQYMHDRILYSTMISDPTVTSHVIDLNVRNSPCLDVEFVVENDKGTTSPQLEAIDLFRIDVNAPDIEIKTRLDGHMTIIPGLIKHVTDANINVCYSVPEVGDLPICHRQELTADELEGHEFISRAVLTPCYDYNVYLEGTSTANNSTIRSLPKAIRMDNYKMFIGNILTVQDVTKSEGSGVTIAVEVNVNWAVDGAIEFVYGMHPAISWRNLADGKIHHKMVKTNRNLFFLNETDGIIGVSETAFWISTCCNENPSACFAQSDEKVITISAGTPGMVRGVSLVWSKLADAYFLHFVEPEQTNSPLRSYHVFLRYSTPSSGLKELVQSVAANGNEVSIKFDQVCHSVIDVVHVTILAYGSDLKNGLIPGRPIHRSYKCSDLIIEGLSTTIMASSLLLAVVLVALLSYVVFNRKQVKLYVQRTFWPHLDKPTYEFHHDSREDFHYSSEKLNLIEVEEITTHPIILPDVPKTFPKTSIDSTIDSGISGSEYSVSSSKSMPIYRLTGGFPFEVRRESNASSGISSASDAASGTQSLHTVSSNHSGDSVLSKGYKGYSPTWEKLFPRSAKISDYVGGFIPVMGNYSVMDNNFGLKHRVSSPIPGAYVSGYVEHTNFNLTNMPTVFLENFKKIQEIKDTQALPYDYISGLPSYEYKLPSYDGYKRCSALFSEPKQNQLPMSSPLAMLPPGYTRANIFDLPDSKSYNEYNPMKSFTPPAGAFGILPPGYTRANIFDLPDDLPTPIDSDYISDSHNSQSNNHMTPDDDGYVGDNFLPSAFKASIRPPPISIPKTGYLPFSRAIKTFGADGYTTEENVALISSKIPSQLLSSDYTTSLDLSKVHIPSVTSSEKRKPLPPSGYVSIEGAHLLHQFN